MDSFDYIHSERQRQMSDEKREQIEEEKLGRSKPSRGILEHFDGHKTIVSEERIKQLAIAKGKAAVQCYLCGDWFISQNSRETRLPLCPEHKNQTATAQRLERTLLDPSESKLDYLKRHRVTRFG